MQHTAAIQANAIRDTACALLSPAQQSQARKAWDSLRHSLPIETRRNRSIMESGRLAFLDALSVGKGIESACAAALARVNRESV